MAIRWPSEGKGMRDRGLRKRLVNCHKIPRRWCRSSSCFRPVALAPYT
jgi:hypothetical protein